MTYICCQLLRSNQEKKTISLLKPSSWNKSRHYIIPRMNILPRSHRWHDCEVSGKFLKEKSQFIHCWGVFGNKRQHLSGENYLFTMCNISEISRNDQCSRVQVLFGKRIQFTHILKEIR